MKKQRLLIANGRLVMPDSIIPHGAVYIENGVIHRSGRMGTWRTPPYTAQIDAGDSYILPGLIDIHSDAIEKEIEPRPGAYFDPIIAFGELEKKLAGQGITSMFHSFSFSGAEYGTRQDEWAADIILNITKRFQQRSVIRNLFHARFEITNTHAVDAIQPLIAGRLIHLLSFMDHTPGQGQYQTIEDFRHYMEKTYHMPVSQIDSILREKQTGRKLAATNVKTLAQLALAYGIPLASHDDDSANQIAQYRQHGVTIHEFPINPTTAQAAGTDGGHIAVGAPNVVRGGSTGKSMRAIDAILECGADILCSDYYPPALLHAIFRLAGEAMTLPEAARLATANPAAATGLGSRGTLEEGKDADIIIVNPSGDIPVVTHTLVGGIQVYGLSFRMPLESRPQDERSA